MNDGNESRPSRNFISVQWLRGLAVLMVVIFHAKSIAIDEVLWEIPIVQDYGWIGVRLFFVISGFIIAESIPNATGLGNYLVRRYLRIFPLYALATLAAIALSQFHGNVFGTPVTESGAPYAPDEWYILKSIFIIPQDPWPFLSVGWSLQYEIAFYFLFGLLYFTLGKALSYLVFISLSFALVLTEGFGLLTNLNFFFYFACGILAHLMFSTRVRIIWPALCLGFGLTYCLYEFLFTGLSSRFVFVSALTFMGLTTVLVHLEHKRILFLRRSFLSRLGDASFSIYLSHFILIMFISVPFREMDLTAAHGELLRWCFVVLSLAIGFATWFVLEKPLQRIESRLLRPSPKQPNLQPKDVVTSATVSRKTNH